MFKNNMSFNLTMIVANLFYSHLLTSYYICNYISLNNKSFMVFIRTSECFSMYLSTFYISFICLHTLSNIMENQE